MTCKGVYALLLGTCLATGGITAVQAQEDIPFWEQLRFNAMIRQEVALSTDWDGNHWNMGSYRDTGRKLNLFATRAELVANGLGVEEPVAEVVGAATPAARWRLRESPCHGRPGHGRGGGQGAEKPAPVKRVGKLPHRSGSRPAETVIATSPPNAM